MKYPGRFQPLLFELNWSNLHPFQPVLIKTPFRISLGAALPALGKPSPSLLFSFNLVPSQPSLAWFSLAWTELSNQAIQLCKSCSLRGNIFVYYPFNQHSMHHPNDVWTSQKQAQTLGRCASLIWLTWQQHSGSE